jgi:hypothetical protein
MDKKKAEKTVKETKDRTPLMPLSGTRKVVRTPTNPFKTESSAETYSFGRGELHMTHPELCD